VQPEVLPQHILCITFTNKAAEELQTRLQQAMKEARAIAAAAGVQQQQQPADDEDLGYSGVLACTFHSWCYRLLRRHFRVSRHNAAVKQSMKSSTRVFSRGGEPKRRSHLRPPVVGSQPASQKADEQTADSNISSSLRHKCATHSLQLRCLPLLPFLLPSGCAVAFSKRL
jgi:superfamily I DNA/RNA helicase